MRIGRETGEAGKKEIRFMRSAISNEIRHQLIQVVVKHLILFKRKYKIAFRLTGVIWRGL